MTRYAVRDSKTHRASCPPNTCGRRAQARGWQDRLTDDILREFAGRPGMGSVIKHFPNTQDNPLADIN
jgi:hypothetical protein